MKASNFNNQHSEKLQATKSEHAKNCKMQGLSFRRLKIAAWNFSGCWFLMLGISLFFTHHLPAAESAWPSITRTARPWCYWWWMGSAVDKTNITRQLQQFHDAGLG